MKPKSSRIAAAALWLALLLAAAPGCNKDESGDPQASLPELPVVTFAELAEHGAAYEGRQVLVLGAQLASGESWPAAGPDTQAVAVSDDGEATLFNLRFPAGSLTSALAEWLAAVGGGACNVLGTVVETWPNAFELRVAGSDDILSIAALRAEDASGIARHLNETVTAEGVVTVAASVLFNNKLKIFIQDDTGGLGEGLMVYHQSAADVEAFQPGDRLLVTGVLRQADPLGGVDAEGTVLVDITQGSWRLLSRANALPAPRPVTLAGLAAAGNDYEGQLVSVTGVHKTSGTWPTVPLQKSVTVTVGDGSGTELTLRLQKNATTAELVAELAGIGGGDFDLTAIAAQDDPDGAPLLEGFEVWVRGAEDILPR